MRRIDAFPSAVEHEPRDRPPSLTHNRRWLRFRARLLRIRSHEAAEQDISVCVDCAVEGKRYGTPLQVDGHHLIPTRERPDLIYREDNVEFLCKRHHRYRNDIEDVGPLLPSRWVVYGRPGAGKSTHVANHAAPNALIWDADIVAAELGYGSYPRTTIQEADLQRCREKWIEYAAQHEHEVWLICMRPNTAYTVACRLSAHVIRMIRHPDGIHESKLCA